MSIFECKALTKNYGVKTVLDSIDLTIEPGRIVGLLGPNGSGKTTLIKLANGLLTPTSGEILIAGKAPCRATKAIVSYLPDRNTLPGWMTIAQALDYYGDFYSDFRRGVAEAMLMNLGLDRTQKIKTLSKGMREKDAAHPDDEPRRQSSISLTSPSAVWTPRRATTSCARSSATTARTQRSSSPRT